MFTYMDMVVDFVLELELELALEHEREHEPPIFSIGKREIFDNYKLF